MPSFAFWKSSKPDEATAPLLSDAAVKEELSVIIPNVSKAVDLNPGNQDSGVFLFDEDAQEIPGDQTPVIGPANNREAELDAMENEISTQQARSSERERAASLLDIEVPSPCPQSPAIVPEAPVDTANIDANNRAGDSDVAMVQGNEETDSQRIQALESNSISSDEPASPVELSQESDSSPQLQSRPIPLVPKESVPSLLVAKTSTDRVLEDIDTNLRDRDSGVYFSDSENSSAASRPNSVVSNDTSPLRTRVSSLSKPVTTSPQRTNSIARLQRPAELNLGFNSAPDPAKPKSELDMRYDLIRNSKTQSKAALRSPTQLLQDRLNMSPKKKDIEERVRVFTPPRAIVNGCLLPGPAAQAEAFNSTSVRAKTEAGGRPAWWCKFDKLVVFDGIEQQADGDLRLRTRTSKGLTISRRRGDLETVVIPLDCAHCHEMLNRHEWKYDMRVCTRSVCWDCKERCKWEHEQEKLARAAAPRTDANRERADSMLQDEHSRSQHLAKEIVV